VKHAGPETLDGLEDLLAGIRALGALKEKGRGVFYRGGSAALHFHEDPAGLFADFRADTGRADFDRFPVSTGEERAAFMKRLRAALA
jgi:hypothetical protein